MRDLNYETTPEFDKDFKKLCKKYKTLNGDLELLKKAVIELFHINNINNNSVFPIPDFCSTDLITYKVKKFACRSMKGKGVQSGLRLIYILDNQNSKIILVQIYYKGEHENADKQRLKLYFNSL